MKPETRVDLYIVNTTVNSDLRDMNPVERGIVEERRLIMARELLPDRNVFTQIVIDAERRNTIAVHNITHREATEIWYHIGTTFGDFNPDHQMFEKVEIEV